MPRAAKRYIRRSARFGPTHMGDVQISDSAHTMPDSHGGRRLLRGAGVRRRVSLADAKNNRR